MMKPPVTHCPSTEQLTDKRDMRTGLKYWQMSSSSRIWFKGLCEFRSRRDPHAQGEPADAASAIQFDTESYYCDGSLQGGTSGMQRLRGRKLRDDGCGTLWELNDPLREDGGEKMGQYFSL